MNEQQQRALVEGLRALADTTRAAAASPHVEPAVMAEFRRRPVAPPAPVARRHRPVAAWMGIAAALTLACVSGIWLSQRAGQVGESTLARRGFFEIPGARYLPPMESGSIVRVELPLAALPSYGIAIAPDMYTDSVQADLLIAQDGLARGIRLVNDSQTSRSTP